MDSVALSQIVERFGSARILCLGDIILDRFVYGTVDRISPEAPIPVLSIRDEKEMLGGAGNVVANLSSLGAHTHFLSVIGDDEAGVILTRMVGSHDAIDAYLQKEKGRISSVKTRCIAGQQQLLRADKETTHPLSEKTQSALAALAESLLGDVDVVVLSDYGKGVLGEALIQSVIQKARTSKKPVIVDPKHPDYRVYRGATIVTPNLKELAAASGKILNSEEAIVAAATALIQAYDFQSIIVTRGKDGMTAIHKDGTSLTMPAQASEVYDVSGAGDTVVAVLALTTALQTPIAESLFLANLAAGIVVGRLGTATVYRTDLKQRLLHNDLVGTTRKILPLHSLLDETAEKRRAGKKIGFTNGCFDLLHPGHLSLLSQAKAACDVLVVGLNSDDSIKRLKGEDRPIQHELARAAVLAAQMMVDYVVLFREDTPLELIRAIRPDVLVKGADYTVETVVGAEIVQSYGGEIKLAALTDGYSTTRLVQKMAKKS